MRIRQLRMTAIVVGAMVVLDALIAPVIMAWAWIAPQSYQALVAPVAAQVDGWTTGVAIATMIVFGRWIYLAGNNLVAAGRDDLEFTPASRIWWFAVPFANLVQPFRGMRELWNASRGARDLGRNNPVLIAWWGLWLGNGIYNWIVGFVTKMEGASPLMTAVQALLGMASAAIGLALLIGITRAQMQSRDSDLAAVFA